MPHEFAISAPSSRNPYRNRRSWCQRLLALVALLFSLEIAGTAAADKLKLVFIMPSLGEEADKALVDRLRRTSQEINDQPPANGFDGIETYSYYFAQTPPEQYAAIESAINAGVDGIAVWPIEPPTIVGAIARARQAGKFAVTFVVDAGVERQAFVGAGFDYIASNLGAMIRQSSQNGGKICALAHGALRDVLLRGLRRGIANTAGSSSSNYPLNGTGWTERDDCPSLSSDEIVAEMWADSATAKKNGATIAQVRQDVPDLASAAMNALVSLKKGRQLTPAETEKKPECGKPCGSSTACGSQAISKTDCPCKSGEANACGS